MPKSTLALTIIMLLLLSAAACIHRESDTRPYALEHYLVEIDLDIRECGNQRVVVQYIENGRPGPSVSYPADTIGLEKTFSDHISLQAVKKEMMITKDTYPSKVFSKTLEYPPGKVQLLIDAKVEGEFMPQDSGYPSLLMYSIVYDCKQK